MGLGLGCYKHILMHVYADNIADNMYLTEILIHPLQVSVDPKRFLGVQSVVDAVEYLHSGKSVGKV